MNMECFVLIHAMMTPSVLVVRCVLTANAEPVAVREVAHRVSYAKAVLVLLDVGLIRTVLMTILASMVSVSIPVCVMGPAAKMQCVVYQTIVSYACAQMDTAESHRRSARLSSAKKTLTATKKNAARAEVARIRVWKSVLVALTHSAAW